MLQSYDNERGITYVSSLLPTYHFDAVNEEMPSFLTKHLATILLEPVCERDA